MLGIILAKLLAAIFDFTAAQGWGKEKLHPGGEWRVKIRRLEGVGL